MYAPHNEFIEPNNETLKIWRYMSLEKFKFLIEQQALYFTRCDKLVEDPFEGSWPKVNVEARQQFVKSQANISKGKSLTAEQMFSVFVEKFRSFTTINCWHLSEFESAIMWEKYAKENKGIAIQSTYQNLKRSLIDEKVVHIGQIKYINYEIEPINANSLFAPYVHKRNCYDYEKEVRAFYVKWPNGSNGKVNLTKENSPIEHGIGIKVDLKILVETIYTAPKMPKGLSELVKVILEKNGFDLPIKPSALDQKPSF